MKIRKATEADLAYTGSRSPGKWPKVVDRIIKEGPVVIADENPLALRAGISSAAKRRGYKGRIQKVEAGFLCSLKKLPS